MHGKRVLVIGGSANCRLLLRLRQKLDPTSGDGVISINYRADEKISARIAQRSAKNKILRQS